MTGVVRSIPFCCEWLADGIGESYRDWKGEGPIQAASRVFIESPTGTGKTTFILRKLCRHAAEEGRRILYLGNRVALKEQMEKEMIREYPGSEEQRKDYYFHELFPTYYVPSADGEREAEIVFLNYQEFLGIQDTGLLKTPDYVVMDEAHFFLEDSLFNPATTYILETLVRDYSQAVLIFLSATLKSSREVLNKVLDRFQPVRAGSVPLAPPQIFWYQNELRKGSYHTQFWQEPEEIVQEICRSKDSGEKWLVFTSSKQNGGQMSRELAAHGIRAGVLNAGGKKSALWRKLVQESRFEEQVLIATKVLDNGVNITDPAVKHIVLPFCAEEDFLQMLGRRRMRTGETVNLYVMTPTVQMIDSQLHRVLEMYGAIKRVRGCQHDRWKMTKLMKELWRKGDQHINGLFYLNDTRNLCPNELAVEKLRQRKEFLEELKRSCLDVDYYPRCVLGWMQGRGGQEVRRLGLGSQSSLEEFLQRYLNRPVPSLDAAGEDEGNSQLERFYQEFQWCYKTYCYERYAADRAKLKELLRIRKGKDQRKATINHSLEALDLPYEVKKERNCWVLRKKDTCNCNR